MAKSRKNKKYMLCVRIYEAKETCVLEFTDKIALDFAYGDIKQKYRELIEKAKAPGKKADKSIVS